MAKIALTWLVAILLIGCAYNVPSTTTVYAKEPIIKVELSIDEMITKYAMEFGVSEKTMKDVMDCENVAHDPTLQSGLHYTKDHPEWGVKKGDRELSFGLVQIHLPSHPSVSYEEATNSDYSIRFLARGLSEGRGSQWSCFRD